MNQIQVMHKQRVGRVRGVYRLRRPHRKLTREGRPYMAMVLEDMSGSIPAYIWNEDRFPPNPLLDFSNVDVDGVLRQRRDGIALDLAEMKVVQVNAGEVVRLIPQSICPVPWLMPVLEVAANRITLEPLASFVAEVLADNSIAFAYVSAPASLNHHHNYPGGLLAHSLECFQMVDRHREFSHDQHQLGLVAALFHDIGKILTLTHEMKRTTLGSNVDHDKLTLETLAPYLKQLDRQWPQGARELRYLLTWKLGRRVPDFDIADLVCCCDRVSAGLDLSRRR